MVKSRAIELAQFALVFESSSRAQRDTDWYQHGHSGCRGVSDLCQIRLTIVDHSRTPTESQTAQRSRPDMR